MIGNEWVVSSEKTGIEVESGNQDGRWKRRGP